MTPDWGAIGAVAAIAAAVIAYLQFKHSKSSSLSKLQTPMKLKYREFRSSGKLKNAESSISNILNVVAIKLINDNKYTIRDIKLRINHDENLEWCHVENTEKIPKESVEFNTSNKSTSVVIPYLNSESSLAISIAYYGLSISYKVASDNPDIELQWLHKY